MDFLCSVDYQVSEGCLTPEQAHYFHALLHTVPEIRNVGEIGFNAGHSSAAFLSARPDVRVVSFDLGLWDCVLHGKRAIDKLFPERHLLIIGDSTVSIPLMRNFLEAPAGTLDLIFIDGGHYGDIPEKDLRNFLYHLAPGGFVIFDDYCSEFGEGGVKAAWHKGIEEGIIVQVDGPFEVRDRGWVVGRKT